MKNTSWKKNLLRTALLALIVSALPVLAGPDNVGLGDGSDGTLTVNAANQVVNVYAQVTAPLAPGDAAIVVGSATGIGADDLLIVLQTTGIVPEPPSGGPTPIDLTSSPVGRWEFARVSTVAGNTLNLTAPLLYSYAANVTQVIRVPEYSSLTINPGRSIASAAWDGSTGGVVAFLVSGTFNNFGSVDARGRGFRGGQLVDDPSGTTGCTGLDEAAPAGAQKGEGIAVTRYGTTATGRGRVANGAGGGICLKSGGGGGGHGGGGGQGGNTDLTLDGNRAMGGEGGAALTYNLLDHVMMGGGGGAGHSTEVAAGVGGGIVFIRANALSGPGSFFANGTSSGSATDAASGGGAGGTIYLRIAGAATCGTIQATGGTGGSTGSIAIGPGGGGGGGRVLFQKGSGTCTLTGTAVIGANPGTQLDPGAPGGASYGATAGSNGNSTVLTGGFAVLPAPVVDTPADGSRINNTTPTYSGTISITPALPAGTEVAIFVDGAEVGRVTPDGLGNWTFTPTATLAPGSHSVNAIAINTSQGVESTVSNTNTFTLDVTPPSVEVTAPADGSRTNNPLPTYSGTVSDDGPPPLTVSIDVDGTVLGDATVTGNTWTFTPTVPLLEGDHTVMATATDAAGNTATDSNTFTVDLTAPTVEVTTPADGSQTNDSTPDYSGTVEAGSTVVITVDGVVLGNATVTGTTWTFTPTVPLLDGPHTVMATATDEAGNTASDSNDFTVDTAPPPAPVVSTPADGSIIADNTPTYSGTAEPGSTVDVIVDGTSVGTTTADSSGNWSLTPTTGLSNGEHTVAATATDAAGNVSPQSNTNTFTVDATIPAAPVITGPANNTVTNDNTPTITGTAPPNSTVTVLVDGTSVGTTTSDAAGNWTFTPTTPLADGPHDFTATTTNAAGNTSPESNTVRIIVDTGVPDTTIVSGPSGDTESTSATFTFSSSEAGVTYECNLDGAGFQPCTNPVTFEDLAEGEHTLQVRARDGAGNVDPTPTSATWTVVRATPQTGDRDFLGDGIGCAASGGDPSSLAMMGMGLLAAVLMARRRRQ